MFDRLMRLFGYIPVALMDEKLATKLQQVKNTKTRPARAKRATKQVTISATQVNHQVLSTLRMARDFYARHGNHIVSVDLDNYLGAFEEALFASATDGLRVALGTNR
jgi:hypothetical protein